MDTPGTTANWFEGCLTGQLCLVELKHAENEVTQTMRSSPKPIARDVPQGSVLGLNVFIIFINICVNMTQHSCPQTTLYSSVRDNLKRSNSVLQWHYVC